MVSDRMCENVISKQIKGKEKTTLPSSVKAMAATTAIIKMTIAIKR